MIVRRVGVLSVGKMLGCVYLLLGLIAGGIFSLLSLAGLALGGAQRTELLLGAGAIVILPAFYGVAGFVGGAILAALYNLVAALAGGIEIDLQPTTAERVP